jgi:hypothetical protein
MNTEGGGGQTNNGKVTCHKQKPQKVRKVIHLPYGGRNVTDLIKALPGNNSVNNVQHATTEEAVVYLPTVTSHNSSWWSSDMCFLSVLQLHKYVAE